MATPGHGKGEAFPTAEVRLWLRAGVLEEGERRSQVAGTPLGGVIGDRGGWRRHPLQARKWPHRRFVEEHGLYQLLGTIRCPGAVHAT